MANYKIISDMIPGKKPGDSITDDELDGINVDALIEGGHISAENPTPKKAEKE